MVSTGTQPVTVLVGPPGAAVIMSDTLNVMRVVPDEVLRRLQRLYDRLCGPSGRVDAQGLKAVLGTLGANFTDADVADLLVEMDPQNKTLDFTDFVTVMCRPLDDDVLEDLRDAYNVLDRQQRGGIDGADVRGVLGEFVNTHVSQMAVRAARSCPWVRPVPRDGLVVCRPIRARTGSASHLRSALRPLARRATLLTQASDMIAECMDAKEDGSKDTLLRLDDFMRVMVQK